MSIEPNSDATNIVLLGSFNPKIFHPSWLALNKLISQEDAKNAELKVVLPELAQFTAADLTFEIQANTFTVRCESIHKERVKDLTLSVFGDILPHSPVWSFGINRSIWFSCGTENVRDRLGALLAPRGPWGQWGQEIEKQVDKFTVG